MITRLLAAMLAALLAGSSVSMPLLSDDGTAAPPAVSQPAPETPAQVPPATEPVKKLTGDEAKAIALAHAGLTAEEVTGLRAKYDLDDRIPEYDVDFRQGDWEYDYSIHAETGKILSWDKEYDPEQAPATQPPALAESQKISADKAKSIALARAGLSADQVKGLRAEYDVDDGVPEYDVEFYADGYAYEFEIHAETGKILSWDKEWDD